MKTAVSIPDDVFKKTERLARRTRKSRSQIVSDALREYIARHSPDEITAALNEMCDKLGEDQDDEFVAEAARRILENTEW